MRYTGFRSGRPPGGGWLVLVVLAGLAQAWGGCRPEPAQPKFVVAPQTRELLLAAQGALQQHEFTQALALVDSADRRQAGLPDVHFLRARILSEMLRLDEAEAAYRKVLDLDPDYPGVWNNLGNNAFRRQDFRKAIGFFHRELSRQPAPIPWYGIGRAYVELGAADSAAHAFREAMALDSTHAPAFTHYALLLQDEGDFEEALRHARRALALDPTNLESHYLVGSLLVSTGRSEEALPYLQEVAAAWPWHHATVYNIGQALVRLGREAEAAPYLKRAEGLRELHMDIEGMEKLVRARPGDPFVHAALASALRRAGRYNDAMHAYRVALHLDPQNLEIQNNVASLHLLRGDTTATIRTYQGILQQDPTLVDAWLNLGVVYAISGLKQEARRAWEAALQHSPGHPAARAYLARLDAER